MLLKSICKCHENISKHDVTSVCVWMKNILKYFCPNQNIMGHIPGPTVLWGR